MMADTLRRRCNVPTVWSLSQQGIAVTKRAIVDKDFRETLGHSRDKQCVACGCS